MKIMFNEDSTHFFYTRYYMGQRVTKKDLQDFIYQYKDTQITDFVMNVCVKVSSFPSNNMESFCDKYLLEEENGYQVNYKKGFASVAYDIFINQRIDMYNVWIDTLREIGIHPWISIRMNDCHSCMESLNKTSINQSEFWHKHPNLRRVCHREPTGYYDGCYDLSNEEIRLYIKNYICEVLQRYDMYGLELDFIREMMCFKIGHETEGMEILNAYIREIKSEIAKAEKVWGHKIKLSVLVNANPITNYNAGFDIMEWAKEGLLDAVVALPRWESVNNDIPVEMWKAMLSMYNVKFAAGHQILISPYHGAKSAPCSFETVVGNAAVYLTNGADFTYLYNYMDLTERWLPNHDFEESVLKYENLTKLLGLIGEKDLVNNSSRSHVLSYYDFPNYWEKINCRLPFVCQKGQEYQFVRLGVGCIPEKAEVSLILGVDSGGEFLEDKDFKIFVNSAKAVYCGETEIKTNLYDNTCYKFNILNIEDIKKYAVIEIATGGRVDFEVHYIEIHIKAAEVIL